MAVSVKFAHLIWFGICACAFSSAHAQRNFTVRLIGSGSSYNEGRIEIFVNGEWGTVCGYGFYSTAAGIVCRQLGFHSYNRYYSYDASYGEGTGPVWLRISQCSGHETSIDMCQHYEWGQGYCPPSSSNTGVRCHPTSIAEQYSIRLSGKGSTELEGRVEINFNGRWGTVCGDYWDSNDAAVVCRQLGLEGPSSANIGAYGFASNDIWLSDVECEAGSDSLATCPHSDWGVHSCDHGDDAGVVCSKSLNREEYSLRLTGTGSTQRDGRVEIFYDGRWGTICHDYFGINDANVVCRQLGFSRAATYRLSGYYGAGSGVIWLDDLNCVGTEETLSSCSHGGFGRHDCEHQHDVGVVCDISSRTSSEFAVRLLGETDSSTEGRVEINYQGQWGSICDIGWDLSDATVACRQLGFSGALRATTGGYFGRGFSTIWMKNVRCNGDERTLASCTDDGWGNTGLCSHDNDAGVVCRTDREEDDYTIRLSGAGSFFNAGRVEIYFNSRWGTICDNSWDINDAHVVCSRLGFKSATSAPKGAYYGQGSGPVWLTGVTCSGTESSLDMCAHLGFGDVGCDHSQDASVVCDTARNERDFEVRLVGGDGSESAGRVEVSYNGQWGTVCGDRWDLNDATVVCKQLGFIGAADISHAYGPGDGPIWLDNVMCAGSEPNLGDCAHNGWGVNDCEHSDDVGVVCMLPDSIPSRKGLLTAGGLAGLCIIIGIFTIITIILIVIIWHGRKRIEELEREKAMTIKTISGPSRVKDDAYENLAMT